MRTNKSTRSKKSPRWEPPIVPAVVLGTSAEHRSGEPRMVRIEVTGASPVPAPQPIEPVDEAVDPWSRPEAMPTRSANMVMLWLLIPFVAVVLYGLLVR